MPETLSAKPALKAASAAVVLSTVLVVAKTAAWLTSGSAALLASMVDSLIDAIVSFSNLLAIRYAYRPADHDHRYGHGKAEGVAALAQAAFIAGSCMFVLLEALSRFSNPSPVSGIDLSVVVLVFSIIATFFLTRFQTHIAEKTGSLAIEADAAHYKTDIVINVGVIISLLIGRYMDAPWVDPITAVMIAGWLLWCARNVAKEAVNMLLDREVDDHTRLPILKIARETDGVEGVHDMRTRKSGNRIMVSLDIEVAPDLTLIAAHEISRDVEARILKDFPEAEVMIHIDPRGDIADSRHKRIKEFHVH